MATVNVVFANAGGKGQSGEGLPTYAAAGGRSENVASPGDSTLQAKARQFARITPIDAAVYATLNGGGSQGWYVAAGSTLDLAVGDGDYLTFKDA